MEGDVRDVGSLMGEEWSCYGWMDERVLGRERFRT